ncbi:MAG: YdcF family protein [Rhodobacteraceae bacterium]|nr:YdcF family protein [Paracoccaceae bacterium]
MVEPENVAPADIIVVLGAGMDPDGTLHRSSILRVEKAAVLFQTGAAPRLHFTGGKAVESGPSAGEMMAQLAVRLGVPRAAISTETASLSTLQNALFSMPSLNGYDRIILVTEGFHLPRAWLSFQWAAAHSIEIALVHSTEFRTNGTWTSGPKLVAREALAFWFNIARVAVWHGGSLMGVGNEQRDNWLQ